MQIFLSYAERDQVFARQLSSELEKRGLSVWNADTEVLPGDNIWLLTGEALKKSKAMIVLLSPDSMRSQHVRREIEYALGNPNYKDRLFPVRVRQTSDVPSVLRKLHMIDFARGAARVSDSIASALKQVA